MCHSFDHRQGSYLSIEGEKSARTRDGLDVDGWTGKETALCEEHTHTACYASY